MSVCQVKTIEWTCVCVCVCVFLKEILNIYHFRQLGGSCKQLKQDKEKTSGEKVKTDLTPPTFME